MAAKDFNEDLTDAELASKDLNSAVENLNKAAEKLEQVSSCDTQSQGTVANIQQAVEETAQETQKEQEQINNFFDNANEKVKEIATNLTNMFSNQKVDEESSKAQDTEVKSSEERLAETRERTQVAHKRLGVTDAAREKANSLNASTSNQDAVAAIDNDVTITTDQYVELVDGANKAFDQEKENILSVFFSGIGNVLQEFRETVKPIYYDAMVSKTYYDISDYEIGSDNWLEELKKFKDSVGGNILSEYEGTDVSIPETLLKDQEDYQKALLLLSFDDWYDSLDRAEIVYNSLKMADERVGSTKEIDEKLHADIQARVSKLDEMEESFTLTEIMPSGNSLSEYEQKFNEYGDAIEKLTETDAFEVMEGVFGITGYDYEAWYDSFTTTEAYKKLEEALGTEFCESRKQELMGSVENFKAIYQYDGLDGLYKALYSYFEDRNQVFNLSQNEISQRVNLDPIVDYIVKDGLATTLSNGGNSQSYDETKGKLLLNEDNRNQVELLLASKIDTSSLTDEDYCLADQKISSYWNSRDGDRDFKDYLGGQYDTYVKAYAMLLRNNPDYAAKLFNNSEGRDRGILDDKIMWGLSEDIAKTRVGEMTGTTLRQSDDPDLWNYIKANIFTIAYGYGYGFTNFTGSISDVFNADGKLDRRQMEQMHIHSILQGDYSLESKYYHEDADTVAMFLEDEKGLKKYQVDYLNGNIDYETFLKYAKIDSMSEHDLKYYADLEDSDVFKTLNSKSKENTENLFDFSSTVGSATIPVGLMVASALTSGAATPALSVASKLLYAGSITSTSLAATGSTRENLMLKGETDEGLIWTNAILHGLAEGGLQLAFNELVKLRPSFGGNVAQGVSNGSNLPSLVGSNTSAYVSNSLENYFVSNGMSPQLAKDIGLIAASVVKGNLNDDLDENINYFTYAIFKNQEEAEKQRLTPEEKWERVKDTTKNSINSALIYMGARELISAINGKLNEFKFTKDSDTVPLRPDEYTISGGVSVDGETGLSLVNNENPINVPNNSNSLSLNVLQGINQVGTRMGVVFPTVGQELPSIPKLLDGNVKNGQTTSQKTVDEFLSEIKVQPENNAKPVNPSEAKGVSSSGTSEQSNVQEHGTTQVDTKTQNKETPDFVKTKPTDLITKDVSDSDIKTTGTTDIISKMLEQAGSTFKKVNTDNMPIETKAKFEQFQSLIGISIKKASDYLDENPELKKIVGVKEWQHDYLELANSEAQGEPAKIDDGDVSDTLGERVEELLIKKTTDKKNSLIKPRETVSSGVTHGVNPTSQGEVEVLDVTKGVMDSDVSGKTKPNPIERPINTSLASKAVKPVKNTEGLATKAAQELISKNVVQVKEAQVSPVFVVSSDVNHGVNPVSQGETALLDASESVVGKDVSSDIKVKPVTQSVNTEAAQGLANPISPSKSKVEGAAQELVTKDAKPQKNNDEEGTSRELWNIHNMPESSDPKRVKALKKMAAGEELDFADQFALMGRDRVVREIDGYKLKPDHVYRAINLDAYNAYVRDGKVTRWDEEDFVEGENNGGVDWYLGGAAPRYGKIIIEAPADKRYFVPAIDSGIGMSQDPEVRHMKSSSQANPLPFSMVKVIKGMDLIENQSSEEHLKVDDQETAKEYESGTNKGSSTIMDNSNEKGVVFNVQKDTPFRSFDWISKVTETASRDAGSANETSSFANVKDNEIVDRDLNGIRTAYSYNEIMSFKNGDHFDAEGFLDYLVQKGRIDKDTDLGDFNEAVAIYGIDGVTLNTGSVVDVGKITDKAQAAKEFAEGNPDLERLLLDCWARGIQTHACCAGHEPDQYTPNIPYVAIDLRNDDDWELYDKLKELLEKKYTISFFPGSSTTDGKPRFALYDFNRTNQMFDDISSAIESIYSKEDTSSSDLRTPTEEDLSSKSKEQDTFAILDNVVRLMKNNGYDNVLLRLAEYLKDGNSTWFTRTDGVRATIETLSASDIKAYLENMESLKQAEIDLDDGLTQFFGVLQVDSYIFTKEYYASLMNKAIGIQTALDLVKTDDTLGLTGKTNEFNRLQEEFYKLREDYVDYKKSYNPQQFFDAINYAIDIMDKKGSDGIGLKILKYYYDHDDGLPSFSGIREMISNLPKEAIRAYLVNSMIINLRDSSELADFYKYTTDIDHLKKRTFKIDGIEFTTSFAEIEQFVKNQQWYRVLVYAYNNGGITDENALNTMHNVSIDGLSAHISLKKIIDLYNSDFGFNKISWTKFLFGENQWDDDKDKDTKTVYDINGLKIECTPNELMNYYQFGDMNFSKLVLDALKRNQVVSPLDNMVPFDIGGIEIMLPLGNIASCIDAGVFDYQSFIRNVKDTISQSQNINKKSKYDIHGITVETTIKEILDLSLRCYCNEDLFDTVSYLMKLYYDGGINQENANKKGNFNVMGVDAQFSINELLSFYQKKIFTQSKFNYPDFMRYLYDNNRITEEEFLKYIISGDRMDVEETFVAKKDAFDWYAEHGSVVQSGVIDASASEKSALKDFIMKKYGLNERDATIIMNSVDLVGACSYADMCNMIYELYNFDAQAFEKDFGYPMLLANGKVNGNQLLLDLFSYSNIGGENSLLLKDEFEKISVNPKYVSGQDTQFDLEGQDDNQKYMSKYYRYYIGYLRSFLKNNNSSVSVSDYRTDDYRLIYDSDVKYRLKQALEENKPIHMGIRAGATMYNLNTKEYETLTGGHAVTPVAMTKDGVIVRSWGDSYYVPFRTFDGKMNTFGNIDILTDLRKEPSIINKEIWDKYQTLTDDVTITPQATSRSKFHIKPRLPYQYYSESENREKENVHQEETLTLKAFKERMQKEILDVFRNADGTYTIKTIYGDEIKTDYDKLNSQHLEDEIREANDYHERQRKNDYLTAKNVIPGVTSVEQYSHSQYMVTTILGDKVVIGASLYNSEQLAQIVDQIIQFHRVIEDDIASIYYENGQYKIKTCFNREYTYDELSQEVIDDIVYQNDVIINARNAIAYNNKKTYIVDNSRNHIIFGHGYGLSYNGMHSVESLQEGLLSGSIDFSHKITRSDGVIDVFDMIVKDSNGFMYNLIQKKTFFPESWDDDKIITSVLKVGDSAAIGVGYSKTDANIYTLHYGIIDGVPVGVIKNSNGSVRTAYPMYTWPDNFIDIRDTASP